MIVPWIAVGRKVREVTSKKVWIIATCPVEITGNIRGTSLYLEPLPEDRDGNWSDWCLYLDSFLKRFEPVDPIPSTIVRVDHCRQCPAMAAPPFKCRVSGKEIHVRSGRPADCQLPVQIVPCPLTSGQ